MPLVGCRRINLPHHGIKRPFWHRRFVQGAARRCCGKQLSSDRQNADAIWRSARSNGACVCGIPAKFFTGKGYLMKANRVLNGNSLAPNGGIVYSTHYRERRSREFIKLSTKHRVDTWVERCDELHRTGTGVRLKASGPSEGDEGNRRDSKGGS